MSNVFKKWILFATYDDEVRSICRMAKLSPEDKELAEEILDRNMSADEARAFLAQHMTLEDAAAYMAMAKRLGEFDV